MVTHNPNLAVGADAEQIIYTRLDKTSGKNKFSVECGSIENVNINKRIGTFSKVLNRHLIKESYGIEKSCEE